MADEDYTNQEINKTAGNVLDIPCIECRRETKHKVLASVDSDGEEHCGGKIRTLGNDAAHEVKPHKPKQLSLALDVCEHLMKGVYLLPHYAEETF
jgi:hypothetical protein